MGQFVSGTTPNADPRYATNTDGDPRAPTAETAPTPMDNPQPRVPRSRRPTAGPIPRVRRIAPRSVSAKAWFVVKDFEGGSLKSDDGNGTTVNSVTFRWTASAAGKNKITYTASDQTTSSVTMTTEVPSTLSGKKDKDLTYSSGTQGAGWSSLLPCL